VSQPNNPDQERFRPASYDLTSSLDPTGGQGQPGAHELPPPPAGYPGYPGYPSPAAPPPPPPGTPPPPTGTVPNAPVRAPIGQQPAMPNAPLGGYSGVYYGPTSGATPPAATVRKPRLGLWLALGVVGVLLVGACCGGGLYLRSFLMAYYKPATVSAPDQVAGMSRLEDANLSAIADRTATELKNAMKAKDAAAGYWAPGGDRSRLFFAVAVPVLILNPDSEARKAFDSSGFHVEDIRRYPAGSQGGTVQCGTTRVQNVPMDLCVWADNASIGITGFYNRDVREAAELVLQVRNDMVTRS
jgi:hypothetical protein